MFLQLWHGRTFQPRNIYLYSVLTTWLTPQILRWGNTNFFREIMCVTKCLIKFTQKEILKLIFVKIFLMSWFSWKSYHNNAIKYRHPIKGFIKLHPETLIFNYWKTKIPTNISWPSSLYCGVFSSTKHIGMEYIRVTFLWTLFVLLSFNFLVNCFDILCR